eukprot:TRINITY_DN8513_c0_g1_i1.p1 TRINITY_DN8513_c0_g1~~TRINITY_DN8513_c0_g1_i1.p1  ORF type:complete len:316 (+),score=67.86 TRINITY_DN8513_c0_g1_i1:169-1116(+)
MELVKEYESPPSSPSQIVLPLNQSNEKEEQIISLDSLLDASKQSPSLEKKKKKRGENEIQSFQLKAFNKTVENTKKTKRKPCQVCKSLESKYCCPSCECRTCSLECTKKHKIDADCDGIRKINQYIPLKQFKDNNIVDDFNFLENIQRTVDVAQKSNRQQQLSFKLKALQNQAKRRKIKIDFMPLGMSKRKSNTTIYSSVQQKIFWKLDWIFLKDNLKTTSERMDGSLKLKDILESRFEDITIRHHLRYYIKHKEGLMFLLQKEFTSENEYYKMDPHLSLEENLRNKDIIEYPTIFVTCTEDFSSLSSAYKILIE